MKLFKMLGALVLTLGLVAPQVFKANAEETEFAVRDEAGVEYTTFGEAYSSAKTRESATLELYKDVECTGIDTFTSKLKDLTIKGNDHTLTFKDSGIALGNGSDLVFDNVKVVMNDIGTTPYDAEWNWVSICASKNASLTLNNNASLIMDGENTTNKHAIYFCKNDKLNLNDSTLEIRNYDQDALEWDGGDGGYNCNLTNSTFISDGNRSGFTGTFYVNSDNSLINVLNSSGNGSNGSYYDIKSSVVNFDNNGSWGISAYAINMSNNSTLTATNNGLAGVWTRIINADSTSKIDVNNNGYNGTNDKTSSGFVFWGHKTINSKIAQGAQVNISNNSGPGIYLGQSICNLDMSSVIVTNNGKGITKTNASSHKAVNGGGISNIGTLKIGDGCVISNNYATGLGGGIYTEGGNTTIENNIPVYNNHAGIAGDDIYSSSSTSKFGVTGSNWILDDCEHQIDGWYQDQANRRWNGDGEGDAYYAKAYEHDVSANVTEMLALKAAHDNQSSITLTFIDLDSGNELVDRICDTYKNGSSYDYTDKVNAITEELLQKGYRPVGSDGDCEEKGVITHDIGREYGYRLGHYSTYEFVSGTEGKELPETVMALTPTDGYPYLSYEVIRAKQPSSTTVKVEDGTWTFVGYDVDEQTIVDSDVKFVGTWTFEEKKVEPTPEPTETPEVTPTPEPTDRPDTPETPEEPKPTVTPEPTETPEVTPTPETTVEPAVTPTATPKPTSRPSTPETGDSSNLFVAGGFLVVSVVAVAMFFTLKKKYSK